jgi:hypothetical protein
MLEGGGSLKKVEVEAKVEWAQERLRLRLSKEGNEEG